MQPNMKKEYRSELKQLRANERVVRRDIRKASSAYWNAKRKLLRDHEREARAAGVALNRIGKRKAILEGRLVS